MPSNSLSASKSVGDCSSNASIRTTVPDFHGTSLGSLITPFSMTAVMLMAKGYAESLSASIRVKIRVQSVFHPWLKLFQISFHPFHIFRRVHANAVEFHLHHRDLDAILQRAQLLQLLRGFERRHREFY